MDEYKWEFPKSSDSEAETVAWMQDKDGRFVGVADGDLELFDPKKCPECQSEAGWLPWAFQRCPRCGHELEPWYPDTALDVPGYWPQEVLPESAVPTGERIQPNPLPLPPGSRLTFVRIPRRDRLLALDGNNGTVWVWNRPAREWRHLLPGSPAPTAYHGVPPRLFGVLSVGSVLVYPTQHGTVWIDMDSPSGARAEVSSWKPIAASAWLSGRCVVPALVEGKFMVATRGAKDPEWQFLEIHQQANAPPLNAKEPIWLTRPIAESHQAHWVGLKGRLYLGPAGEPEWHGWHSRFQPVLGSPPLQTFDNRRWMIGEVSTQEGKADRAFATVAVPTAPECKLVNGAFFTLGRLCLRFCNAYNETPWSENESFQDQYRPCGEDNFLIPLSALGSDDALLLKMRNRSLMNNLLEQNVSDISGLLVLGREGTRLDDMQVNVRADYLHWPQAFYFSNTLYLYEPLGTRLFAWPTE